MQNLFDANRLKRLYEQGRLSASGINNAVARGYITADQAEEILAAKIEEE